MDRHWLALGLIFISGVAVGIVVVSLFRRY
jgi:uncharacterized membrane-anchored protein YhcB (DUF1043 family)